MVKRYSIQPLLFACSVLLILSGCEQFFTYCPIAFLERPVSEMTEEQQIKYGEDALASGDREKMKDAYEELSQNETSGDAQYVAAQLAVELSGISEYILATMDPESGLPLDITDDADLFLDFVEENGLHPEFLALAAENLIAAQELGETLGPMDYLMGSLGLVIGAAIQSDGELDFTAMDADKLDEAEDFITQAAAADLIDSLPDSDPMKALLSEIRDYVVGL
jgi:hypothetical protein